MEIKELKHLIDYHQAGLGQYRQHMAPSSQFLEEQTVKVLKELEKRLADEEKSARVVKTAENILKEREAE